MAAEADEASDYVDALLPLPYLIERLDPQYHVDEDEERQDWQVPPRWDLVARYAADMKHGTFDFDQADEDGDINLHLTPTGEMLTNGNHRVLAAEAAGVPALRVTVTRVPGCDWPAEVLAHQITG